MLQPFSFSYLIDDFVFMCLRRFKQGGKVQQKTVRLLHSTSVSYVPPFSNQSVHCILAVHTVNHSAPASWLTAPQGRTYWLPW